MKLAWQSHLCKIWIIHHIKRNYTQKTKYFLLNCFSKLQSLKVNPVLLYDNIFLCSINVLFIIIYFCQWCEMHASHSLHQTKAQNSVLNRVLLIWVGAHHSPAWLKILSYRSTKIRTFKMAFWNKFLKFVLKECFGFKTTWALWICKLSICNLLLITTKKALPLNFNRTCEQICFQ